MKTIEFLGMPRAGKTEQIRRLSKYFDKKGISHTIITDREIEKEVTCSLENAYDYNIMFFKKILEKVRAAEQEDKTAILILDRGFIDAQAWFEAEYEGKNLNKEEMKKSIDFLKPLQGKYSDLGILMMITPILSFARFKKKGERSLTDDYVMTKEYVDRLYSAYKKIENDLAKKNNILILEGTLSMDELEKIIREKIDFLL